MGNQGQRRVWERQGQCGERGVYAADIVRSERVRDHGAVRVCGGRSVLGLLGRLGVGHYQLLSGAESATVGGILSVTEDFRAYRAGAQLPLHSAGSAFRPAIVYRATATGLSGQYAEIGGRKWE